MKMNGTSFIKEREESGGEEEEDENGAEENHESVVVLKPGEGVLAFHGRLPATNQTGRMEICENAD